MDEHGSRNECPITWYLNFVYSSAHVECKWLSRFFLFICVHWNNNNKKWSKMHLTKEEKKEQKCIGKCISSGGFRLVVWSLHLVMRVIFGVNELQHSKAHLYAVFFILSFFLIICFFAVPLPFNDYIVRLFITL